MSDTNRTPLSPAARPSRDELLMAMILVNRYEPLAPHHAMALRERLSYRTDAELLHAVRTGRWPLPD